MQRMPVLALTVALVVTFALPAASQPVATCADIVMNVKVGDRVEVLDTSGRNTTGRVRMVAPEKLVLDTPEGATSFLACDVLELFRRDDLLNGAMIGAAAGAALGIGFGVAWQGSFFEFNPGLGGLVAGGIGAAIGAVVDALIPGGRTFRADRRVVVLPTLARGRTGVDLVVRW
jgi:hypothetical protein